MLNIVAAVWKFIRRNFRWAVLILVLILVTSGVWYVARLSDYELTHHKRIADIVQSFALAIGAIITALGGFSLIDEWLRKREQSSDLIREWKKRFPAKKLGDDSGYEFIVKRGSENHIYVLDRRSNQKRHVANSQTLRKVWFPDPPKRILEPQEFDAIDYADSIDITI